MESRKLGQIMPKMGLGIKSSMLGSQTPGQIHFIHWLGEEREKRRRIKDRSRDPCQHKQMMERKEHDVPNDKGLPKKHES